MCEQCRTEGYNKDGQYFNDKKCDCTDCWDEVGQSNHCRVCGHYR